MQSIEETIRKSKAVTEKYNKYLLEREQYIKQQQETRIRLNNTIQLLQTTIQDINVVTNNIDNFQDNFSKAIDALAVSATAQGVVGLNIRKQQIETARDSNSKQVIELIRNAKKIMVLTGAGMSAASGLKTFRGEKGYWTQKEGQMDPKTILTNGYYQSNPESCWNWLIQFHKAKMKAKPNQGHYFLQKLRRCCMKMGKSFDIVTQNIDNLHMEAQQELQVTGKMKKMGLNISKQKTTIKPITQTKLFQIHGNITKLRCQQCTSQSCKLVTYPTNFSTAKLPYHPPLCSKCKTPLRPHIMMFDESYSQSVNSSVTLKQIFEECDLFLVIGTALETGMANHLVNRATDLSMKIVEINPEKRIKYGETYTIKDKSQVVLEQIYKGLNV